MSNVSLTDFIAHAVRSERITSNDVNTLLRDILPDGVTSRDEADLLVALDRAVGAKDAAWAEYLVNTVVHYVVWTERRTGYVDAETARWLIASLSCGEGPTSTAMRIAFETVQEAEHVDEALTAFAMRSCEGRGGALGRAAVPAMVRPF